MSTLAYAKFTSKRDEATANESTSTEPPGVSTYVDALAALVPAEVLTLHAVILTVTTKTEGSVTSIIDGSTLSYAFYGLIVLAVVLYVGARLLDKKWDKLDYLRVLIPPLSFVGWTMMQRATAFDAVAPATLGEAARTVIALFLGVLLGLAATALAYKADQNNP